MKALIRAVYSSEANKFDPLLDDCGVQKDLEIGRETFDRILTEPRVIELLEQLGVDEVDSVGLFDVLDSDDSGTVSTEELVDGILMVRGQLKKSDTIATRLAVKAIQTSLHNCRIQLLQQAIDTRVDLQNMSIPVRNG